MKKSITSFLVCAIALLLSNEGYAQKFSDLDNSPMDVSAYPANYKISDKTVKVFYSRPQLKGRFLRDLAPKDKVWRTGANEAAVIVFYKDVNFGGKDIKAGTYSLFTIPGDNEWTIIISTATNVWGSYFYDESEDVIRVTAPVKKSMAPIEAFSIIFDKADDLFSMHMGWGDVIVSVPIIE
jgi:hypothetical protein